MKVKKYFLNIFIISFSKLFKRIISETNRLKKTIQFTQFRLDGEKIIKLKN